MPLTHSLLLGKKKYKTVRLTNCGWLRAKAGPSAKEMQRMQTNGHHELRILQSTHKKTTHGFSVRSGYKLFSHQPIITNHGD
jgi:hypothetical protein